MTTTENEMKRTELFDIVMLKEGVSEFEAKTTDFKRVPVEARDPLQAQMSEAVAKEKGYRVLFAAKPGVLTDPEIMARRRELDAVGHVKPGI
jgi:hypothetical protein